VRVLDGLSSQLEHYLDLVSSRQKLVASNIANADTPGYRTRDINFAEEFQNALPGSSPIINEVDGLKTKNDGNNVSIDRESRLLTENDMRFNIATQILKSQISSLKSAIAEGK
jgi:flagellar basal-body rod protein FlgB